MKRSGFTLIELLAASVVLAVLAAIAIPNFTRMQIRAKESEVKSVAHALQMAVEDYKAMPGHEGNKPIVSDIFTYVVPCLLPVNVQNKANPFSPARITYSAGEIEAAAAPFNPTIQGRVSYGFENAASAYEIRASGNMNYLILTLIEGH